MFGGQIEDDPRKISGIVHDAVTRNNDGRKKKLYTVRNHNKTIQSFIMTAGQWCCYCLPL